MSARVIYETSSSRVSIVALSPFHIPHQRVSSGVCAFSTAAESLPHLTTVSEYDYFSHVR